MYSKIGLLDHMGGGNLGDDATQTAIMACIRRRLPDVTFYGFSMNPDDTARRHKIQAHPLRREIWHMDAGALDQSQPHLPPAPRPMVRRIANGFKRCTTALAQSGRELRFLARSYRAVRAIDLLLISGGGQLLDAWGGPWCFPYTLLKWVFIARIARRKCYFINVGAGPIQHRLSRVFILLALRLANYVSFRDEDSKALISAIGFRKPAEVFPDCVYGLVPGITINGRKPPLLGLSPMAYCDPRRYWLKDQQRYDALLEKLAQFGAWAMDRHEVTLFSTDIWFDAQTIREVKEKTEIMRGTRRSTLDFIRPIADTDELLAQLSELDAVVTCRFHGVVFAHVMNIPVIALSHHPKVRTLMSAIGLSEYCLDIETFDVPLLIERFERLTAERDVILAKMELYAARFRQELDAEFDQLFSPTVNGRSSMCQPYRGSSAKREPAN